MADLASQSHSLVRYGREVMGAGVVQSYCVYN